MTLLLLSGGLTLYCCMLGFEWDPTEVPDGCWPSAARRCPKVLSLTLTTTAVSTMCFVATVITDRFTTRQILWCASGLVLALVFARLALSALVPAIHNVQVWSTSPPI